MSEKPSRKGKVGSQYWMRKIPESPLKEQMDMVLDDTLGWLSPLESDLYKEYQLNSPVIKAELGINSPLYQSAFDFWPTNQPMWDGLALSDKSGTLYLFEAKAHTKEPKTECKGEGEGRRHIIQTMTGIHEKYFSKGVFDKWMTGQYQLANRLTFLQKMKDMKRPEYPNVKLIFISFINDYTLTPTSKDEWKDYYQ